MGKGWTSDDPVGVPRKDDQFYLIAMRQLGDQNSRLEEKIKRLEKEITVFRSFYDADTGLILTLQKRVSSLKDDVKYWSELARLNSDARGFAVDTCVRSVDAANAVTDLWCKRAMYAKDIIWKLIDWINADPGKQCADIARSLPKWVRKEAWGVPSR